MTMTVTGNGMVSGTDIPPEVEEALAEARRRVESRTLVMGVGRWRVGLEVVGPVLAEALFSPLRHVQADGETGSSGLSGCDITIRSWSAAETGLAAGGTGGVAEWTDFARRQGVCCFPGPALLTRMDMARPFQRILLPLLQELGLYGMHGALVAARGARNSGPGLLMTGSNGSGKSTTALAAVMAGFGMAGDDCVVIGRGNGAGPNGFSGCSLYRTCCLTHETRQAFSSLPEPLPGPLAVPAGAPPEAKGVLTLPAGEDGPMVRSLPVSALVFPFITGQPGASRCVAIGEAEAYRRFMPGLRLTRQEPLERRKPCYEALTAMIPLLPKFRLELGQDMAAVPEALFRLSEGLA